MADLRRNLERQMFVSQVQQRDIADKISVTEEEAKAYYEAHKGEFTTPSQITLREILIDVPAGDKGINVGQDDEAKGKAEAHPQASGRGRAVCAPGRRAVRRAVEGQRRVDRTGQPRRARGAAAGARGQDEGRRSHRGDAHRPRLSDSQARGAHRHADPHVSRTPATTSATRWARQSSTGERLKYLEKLRGQATITFRNDELKKAYEQALAARQKAQVG